MTFLPKPERNGIWVLRIGTPGRAKTNASISTLAATPRRSLRGEGVMKNLAGLLLAVVLAAGAPTLVTPHPSAATPILPDYSGASY